MFRLEIDCLQACLQKVKADSLFLEMQNVHE